MQGEPIDFCMPAAVINAGCGTVCGQEVANLYCRTAGYSRAWEFSGPKNAPRTLSLTTGKLPRKSCEAADSKRCQTFVAIDCIREKVFDSPKLKGVPVDYCSTKGCGKPAADDFCFKSNTHTSSSNVKAADGKTFAKITCVI